MAYPNYSNTWETDMRRVGGLNAQNILNQQYMQMLGNLSRMGLNKSGWRTTLMNPAYQTYGMNLAKTEADIDEQRQGWERLRLLEEQIKQQNKKTGLGGLLGGLGGLGIGLLTGGAGMALLPWLMGGQMAGSVIDYSQY